MPTLKGEITMPVGSRGFRLNLRKALVVLQVGLSLFALITAALFVRSLQKLLDVNPGFRPEGIVSVRVDLRPAHYSKARLPEVKREILDRVRTRTGARR